MKQYYDEGTASITFGGNYMIDKTYDECTGSITFGSSYTCSWKNSLEEKLWWHDCTASYTNAAINNYIDYDGTGTITATTVLSTGMYSAWENKTELTGYYARNLEELTWGARHSVRVVSPVDRMREILRSRSAPAIHRGRVALTRDVGVREARARATLRNMLGDQSFRKFLRDGFITVLSKSGLTYRIYPGHLSTHVYDRGVKVETMCVVLKGNFPPTDELIMRYLLILNDEGEFSQYAVRHRVTQDATFSGLEVLKIPEVQSLPVLFAEMKAEAA